MSTRKDPQLDETAAAELSKTVQLAVQAFDGHLLSDAELEVLCEAILSEPVNAGEEESKS